VFQHLSLHVHHGLTVGGVVQLQQNRPVAVVHSEVEVAFAVQRRQVAFDSPFPPEQ